MSSNASKVTTNLGAKTNSLTTKVGNIANSASNAAKNAAKKAAASGKMPLIIIIGVTVLLFVFVILYITFAMKSSSLQGKVLTSKPIKLDQLGSPIQIPNGDMPKPSVGREYTYAFWMYLERFNQSRDSATNLPLHKLIMYRGNAEDLSGANPIIFMDGLSNKLYIVIKTTESAIADKNLDSILTNNYFMTDKRLDDTSKNLHLVMVVDYVPLQRWVHVAAVVDNKVITLYMDGEIYSVKSVDEFKAARQPHIDRLGKVVPYNLIIDTTDGDLYLGKNNIGNRITIDGYLGKVEYFNYALTMNEVKQSYYNGPLVKGVLSMFGISQYGFRSPVYKLNEVVQ
jgi:hypothetical protein